MPNRHLFPNATLPLPVVIQNGGSGPRVFDFDDQVFRLVKWHPSSHGITATYSELAASRLAQLLSAPALRAMPVWIPEPMLPSPGQNVHLGFTFLHGENFLDTDYPSIKNRAVLPAAALQLCWLRVGDQQGHNQYLWRHDEILPDKTSRTTNHFMLIDLAAMFETHDWSGSDLGDGKQAYNLPTHLKAELSMKLMEPYLEAVQDIPEEDILGCFVSPEDWGLPASLAEKATTYLLKRRPHLADIVTASLS